MRAVGAIVGTLAALTVGLAPGATADEQSKQWYLKPMQAEQMWKVSTGKGVKVAVIDTGVNPDTPSLKGQVLADEVPKSVAYLPPADEMLASLRAAGFESVERRLLSTGISQLITATRSAGPA